MPTKTELADIKYVFAAFGPTVFQLLKSGLSAQELIDYVQYGNTTGSVLDEIMSGAQNGAQNDFAAALPAPDTPTESSPPSEDAQNPIYAAQGGSIDDLIEYLRR